MDSKKWKKQSLRYLKKLLDNPEASAEAYVRRHRYRSKARRTRCLFLAQLLDEILELDVPLDARAVQRAVRQIVALEMMDEHESDNWEMTTGIVYPLDTQVLDVEDLRLAHLVTRARQSLRSSLLQAGRGKPSSGGNIGNANSRANNKNNDNNSNNNNNSSSSNNNNNRNSGGRGGRRG